VKAIVIALWIACIAAFAFPATSTLAFLGQRLFWGLLIVHAVECVLFLPKLRRAGGSLARHLVQTMIFGLFYARSLGENTQPSAS
jgi:uncharacterized protein YhhL (DUF1145 family)